MSLHPAIGHFRIEKILEGFGHLRLLRGLLGDNKHGFDFVARRQPLVVDFETGLGQAVFQFFRGKYLQL